MNKNFYGEYSIHLVNDTEENIITVKNTTTELLKNYINYGYYYPTLNQSKFYYKNDLNPMKNTYWWEPDYNPNAKFVGNFNRNEYAIPNYYVVLYNCSDNINIYETSKNGINSEILPIKEFFDIMRVSNIIIDKNNNKFILKFTSSEVTVNNMSFNKIILMHINTKVYVNDAPVVDNDEEDTNENPAPAPIVYDIFTEVPDNVNENVYISSKGSAQISESNLQEPIVITSDTNFFIEYTFTFDYSELLNYPTGTFNYKYYENNQLKEKTNEYIIKSNFLISIENAIGICEHIEKKYHENLELNKIKYEYTDEEYNFIKNKFEDIYWTPGGNIYPIEKILYKDDAKRTEINVLLIPSRFINSSGYLYTQDLNHNYYFYMNAYDPYLNIKKYQYAFEKYILSDMSFEEKVSLIQYYSNGMEINNFSIPRFQLPYDINFINKDLKMNKLDYIFNHIVNNKKYAFDTKFTSNNNDIRLSSTETRLYASNIKNVIYFNNKRYEYVESVESIVDTIILKEDYIKLLENSNTYNLDYNYLNLKRGIYAISQFNYAYTMFFKEPIHKDLDLNFTLIPDISIGVQ